MRGLGGNHHPVITYFTKARTSLHVTNQQQLG